MGVEELLDVDPPAYANMLRTLSTPQLKAREEEKTRHFLSNSCSLGLGVGALVPTGGISAIWMAYAAQRMNVSWQKLGLIQAELQRRRVPLKKGISSADKKVAVVGGLTSLVVGEAVLCELGEGGGSGGGGGGGNPTFGEVFQSNVAGDAAAGVSRGLMDWFMRRKK